MRRTFLRDSQWYDLEDSENQLPDSQRECMICLMEKCDTKVDCGHWSHLKCLKDWVRLKQVCPMCRKKMSTVKYYCPKCFNHIYQF